MLVKLTAIGVADPKSTKKTVKLSSFIALWGSARVKAACRRLVKMTLGWYEDQQSTFLRNDYLIRDSKNWR